MRIFVEVMRRGSFAAVARDRRVDPSSISRTIASLESDLGLRLFHRTTRRLSPTQEGVAYFDRVEPLIDELEQAREAAADLGEQPKGELRLLAPVSFSLLNIVPLLPELEQLYPELTFKLLLTDALLDLVEEKVDVAIRLGPLADSGLIARRLAPMTARVCASPRYLQRRGRPKTPEELVDHECLLLNMPGFDRRWKFRALGGGPTREIAVGGKLLTSNAVALKDCALAGMGIILQARWIVGRELRRGELVDLFPDEEVTASTFDNAAWILYPSRAYLPLKVRATVDFLLEKFRERPPWDHA